MSRTWYYDTTSPLINLQGNNEWNINNYSMNNQYDDIFQFNFTLTDNIALYGILVNVTNSTGQTVYNDTNLSLSGTTHLVDNTPEHHELE